MIGMLFARRSGARRRALTLVAVGVVTVLAGGMSGACRGPVGGTDAARKASAPQPLYHCPMHPEVVSDKPGDCPICGMRLVPIPASASPRSPTPPSPAGSAGEHTQAPAEAATRPLDIGSDRASLAGIRSVEAVSGTVTRTIRAVGTVAVDETRVRQVTTKVAGFVERLFVNATGQPVRQGEPLLELYSPELLASQEEYLRARRSAAEFQKSALPEVQRGGAELAAAARLRLELFDVPAEFLRTLDDSGAAQRTVTFNAPFSGVVTAKNVVAGQRIEPGMELLTVTDMSRVWVVAQVFEAEASAARPGRAAKVTLPYGPGVVLSGRIGLVYPTLDADTRTLRVRLEFANSRGVLRPGMYVNVELGTEKASGVVVPDSAVIDSGPRQIVFVEASAGRFEPRDIGVALRADGQAVIRSGLAAGERVAVSANFLLDSESRLRNAVGAGASKHQER